MPVCMFHEYILARMMHLFPNTPTVHFTTGAGLENEKMSFRLSFFFLVRIPPKKGAEFALEGEPACGNKHANR